ncbi:MAG: glycosyltransferase [Candidatus Vogelbacteria bacterium]|nr:glycosyltransferase [Candidatus Vogelbacteria bacterium]
MLNEGPIFLVITKGSWGGASRYVYDLLTNLPNDSRKRVLITGTSGQLTEKVAVASHQVITVPGLGRNISPIQDFLVGWRLYRLFKNKQPSVVHLNSSKIGGLGALAARLAGIKKIIYTVHGWPFMEQRFVISRIIIWLLSYFSVILAHRTIVLGKEEKKRAWGMFGVQSKIKVIPLGLAPLTLLVKEEARAALGLTGLERVVGSIGELHPNKGYDLLIESWPMVTKNQPDLKLVLIGEGEQRSHLEILIKERGLSDQVILAGQYHNASQYLTAFDLFILPSRKEGLPYVLLEAGLAGVPIIASSVGGIPDLITTGVEGILVPPNDSEILIKTINANLIDLSNAKNMANALPTKIKRDYALDWMIKQTYDLY